MKLESAQVSLLGTRAENQDRVAIKIGPQASLMVVVDGMGGHSDGALAAEEALNSVLRSFSSVAHPIFDPLGFLHRAAGRAHARLIELGGDLQIDARPRATCAMVLLQEGASFWAHIGDSRIYRVRNGSVLERTRDHSHVELLLREGVITEAEVRTHPMRNFVECCLGGDPALPEMSVTRRKPLQPDELLLVCSDGMWSGVQDQDFATLSSLSNEHLAKGLEELALAAVEANLPHSDNTTLAAVRCLGT
ncbi:MAG: serine/threonine-protein phosphatase [Gammaproteobacteria bacterium]|nr:serine/threonine-protein phosphatase [Gammaproteobacteria bacterium]